MATGSFLEFDANASLNAVVVLLVLGATLVLPIAPTPLLKLKWQSARIHVVLLFGSMWDQIFAAQEAAQELQVSATCHHGLKWS